MKTVIALEMLENRCLCRDRCLARAYCAENPLTLCHITLFRTDLSAQDYYKRL